MVTNQRRYERLHYLFGTFRKEQLAELEEVLDPSQWIELMALYRQMAEEAELEDAELPASKGR